MQKPPGKRAPSTRRLRVGALAGGAVGVLTRLGRNGVVPALGHG